MLWGEEIGPYLPEPIDVRVCGWAIFLKEWSEKALAAICEISVYEGMPAGKYGRTPGKELPRESIEGGLRYPGTSEDEQRHIEAVLRQIRDVVLEAHRRSTIRSYHNEMIANRGAFRPPCRDDQIAQLEERLQMTLPKSYADFLRISNGWLLMNTYLLPTEKIDWYQNSPWFEWFTLQEEFFPERVSDKDYFVYGVHQHPVRSMRKEYVPSFLLISDAISDFRGLQFLNPKVIFEDGEWEAVTSFGGGFVRFRSFAAMMEQLYRRDIGYKRYYIDNLMRKFGGVGVQPR